MPVIVIDPGHGGESLGGNIDNRIERDIDLITAFAMKERLEEYEDVEVYLTREDNESKELTRKERFEFAKEKNADFLYSIHYNMSESHTLFGSEVWICSEGPNYSYGMSFAKIEMEELTSMGLFDRGIKCKQDKKGGEYYGILKYSQEYNIPAVIIEHCHLDEERDSAFWNTEAYRNFGINDADCVAKYYGLHSDSLGIDYSNYIREDIPVPTSQVQPDLTGPDYCNLSILENTDLTATCSIESEDTDTYVQYYSYSVDGGFSWSELFPWEDRSVTKQTFNVNLSEKGPLNLCVQTMNMYDISTVSNTVMLPQAVIEIPEEESESFDSANEFETYEEIVIESGENVATKDNSISAILIFLLIILFIAITSFSAALIVNSKIQKRKRKKKNNRKDKQCP